MTVEESQRAQKMDRRYTRNLEDELMRHFNTHARQETIQRNNAEDREKGNRKMKKRQQDPAFRAKKILQNLQGSLAT